MPNEEEVKNAKPHKESIPGHLGISEEKWEELNTKSIEIYEENDTWSDALKAIEEDSDLNRLEAIFLTYHLTSYIRMQTNPLARILGG